MATSRDEVERIQRLRQLFLHETCADAALPDYWRTDEDLGAYERVLARRIGWKWDAALGECKDRGMLPDADAVVLDFGCGSGIASRRYVQTFSAREVLCHDRSPRAMAYATDSLRRSFPGLVCRPAPRPEDAQFDTLLCSHVLGELDEPALAALAALARRARRIVLVEPGSRKVSRRLSALRDDLGAEFFAVAPCPNAARCPALANADEWCHFFAEPPAMAFTDGDWVKTARALGVDQRALPYSFVAMERRSDSSPPAVDHRILGRPRVGRHEATVQCCHGDALRLRQIDKRTQKELWRRLKKDPHGLRQLPGPLPGPLPQDDPPVGA